jgi:hypothetical protein
MDFKESVCKYENIYCSKELCLQPAFPLVSCSAYSSTLKMDAKYSSEKSVVFQRTTLRYIPEDSTLHNHRCESLKSCKTIAVVSTATSAKTITTTTTATAKNITT